MGTIEQIRANILGYLKHKNKPIVWLSDQLDIEYIRIDYLLKNDVHIRDLYVIELDMIAKLLRIPVKELLSVTFLDRL